MEKQSQFTGIILAGGKSRRLGVNKALVEVNGRKLIEYPVHLLEKSCSQILISSNQPLPLPYPTVADVISELGPMAGIYSCLLQSKTPYNIVVSCDMPLLNEDLIAFLSDSVEGGKIIVPVHHNQLIEPLCAVYPTLAAPPMFEFIRQRRLTLHEFISDQPHNFLNIGKNMNFWFEDLFLNVNTPEDLEKIKHN